MSSSGEPGRRPRGSRLRRIGLASAAALVTINIWAGSPLFAVWVGSRVQGGTAASMTAVVVVVLVLSVLVFALSAALAWINARYDALVGRPPALRRTYPWLRSMRAERPEHLRGRRGMSAVERIVVVGVVLAVLAFEVWFLLFAGSSLPRS